MMLWSESELWFYGGIVLMTAAVVLTVLCIIIFNISGRKLRNKLEKEYGKRH